MSMLVIGSNGTVIDVTYRRITHADIPEHMTKPKTLPSVGIYKSKENFLFRVYHIREKTLVINIIFATFHGLKS